MSWALDLTADRPIEIADATAIVATLPANLRGRFNAHENEWGWSAATDISIPKDETWQISGAGYSRAISAPMALALAAGLRKYGYQVSVGERRD